MYTIGLMLGDEVKARLNLQQKTLEVLPEATQHEINTMKEQVRQQYKFDPKVIRIGLGESFHLFKD